MNTRLINRDNNKAMIFKLLQQKFILIKLISKLKVVGFAVAAFASCKKSDTPAPAPTKTLLSKIIYGQGLSFETRDVFHYSSDGKLTSYSRVSNSGVVQSTYTPSYDAQGNITNLLRGSINSNPPVGEDRITYSGGKIAAISRYHYNNTTSSMQLVSKKSYTYSGNALTVSKENGSAVYLGKEEGTFDSKGNILEYKNFNAANTLASSRTYSGYDDKKNPYALLPPALELSNPEFTSQNNHTREVQGSTTYTTTYEYNADGYVTERLYSGPGVPAGYLDVFEYIKL
jgi:hypothetical protein